MSAAPLFILRYYVRPEDENTITINCDTRKTKNQLGFTLKSAQED